MTTRPHFEVRQLIKTFDRRKILDIDELDFAPGQFVALMGKNGSGKSTLMRLLAQQDVYDSGSITYGGLGMTSTKLELNGHLVFVAEDHELPFVHAVGDWIGILERQYPKFDRNLCDRLFASFGVDLGKPFHALSRGQRVKALFALEAAKKPDVYILDEITAVLDVGSRMTLMEFLKSEAARGCTVLTSTNIASEMQGFATDVAIIEDGRVVFRAPSRSLGDHFVKVRLHADRGTEIPTSLDARRVGFNADARWSFLCRREGFVPAPAFEVDAREITLAELQAYFTAGHSE